MGSGPPLGVAPDPSSPRRRGWRGLAYTAIVIVLVLAIAIYILYIYICIYIYILYTL